MAHDAPVPVPADDSVRSQGERPIPHAMRPAGHVRPDHDVPVLLIVFNRPDKVRKLIEVLRETKPRHLFVAADGPRSQVERDAALCKSTLEEIDHIDWPCSVRFLAHQENQGCKAGPETAISWFFSQVDEGIIVEDDCLPEGDFFPFCNELLARYRHDQHVMMIGGHSHLGTWSGDHASYVFSGTSPTWGWATWASAWQHYDPDMSGWDDPAIRATVKDRMTSAEFRLVRRRFDLVRSGALDAWDFAWAYAMLRLGGVSAVPRSSLITNIGFGEDATHTRNPRSADARIPTGSLNFPLVHPQTTEASADFDRALYRHRFPPTRRLMTVIPFPLAERLRSMVEMVRRLSAHVRQPTNRS